MGRAMRWFKSLLGRSEESREQKDNNGSGVEKKRWSFGKSGRKPGEGAAPLRAATPEEAVWLQSMYSENATAQNKHAIAVAAATAAAADAAVAAAQAAVAVVRLTSHRRCGGALFVAAAVKIQTVFRAYLAKKALRALKALVKLQALVRGYLVRRQASATLHCMQALIRAQATVRANKSRANDRRYGTETRPLGSLERFDDKTIAELSNNGSSYGYDRSPKIVEVDTMMDSGEDELPPVPMSSPLPCCPARISIPDCPIFHDYDDRCRGFSSTAQSTPRCYAGGIATNAPPTPAKSSVCAADWPNYMSSTQSFEAKVRSHSAPKQRPQPRKRIPLSEMSVESRSEVQQAFSSFKSVVMSRFDKSIELGRGDSYLQRKW